MENNGLEKGSIPPSQLFLESFEKQNLQRRQANRRAADLLFIRRLCQLLFVLFVLISLGLGLSEAYFASRAAYGVLPADAARWLLKLSLLPGIPLMALCLIHLQRIRRRASGEKPGLYRLLLGWAALTLSVFVLLSFFAAG